MMTVIGPVPLSWGAVQ